MRTILVGAALVALVHCSPAAAPPRSASDPLPTGAVARLGHARMVGTRERLFVSHDGKHIHSGKWFDVATGRPSAAPVAVPDDALLSGCFSDGSILVGADRHWRILDAKAGKPRIVIPCASGIYSFDNSGRFALQFSDLPKGFEVALIDLRPGDLVKGRRVLTRTEVRPEHGLLSADGKHAVWMELDHKNTPRHLCFYDAARAKTTHLALPTTGNSMRVHLSPDGKHIALHDQQTVYLLDTSTGKVVRTVEHRADDSGFDCAFTPDGKEVAATSNPDLLMIPCDPKQPTRRFSLGSVAFFPDSKRVAAVDWFGVVRIHDLKTGKRLDTHSRFPRFDGVQMIGEHSAASWSSSGTVVTWDIRTGRVLSEMRLQVKGNSDWFQSMRFSHDGKHVAAWTYSCCVVAETASGKVIVEVVKDAGRKQTAFFPPSGKEVAIVDTQKRVYRHADLASGKWSGRWSFTDEEDIHVCLDGRTLLGASHTAVRLREVATGQARWQVTMPQFETCRGGPRGRLSLVALVEKGRRAVIVRDIDAYLLDTQSGRIIEKLSVGSRVAAVSACGRWLAVATDQKRVRLFDWQATDPKRPAFEGELPCGEINGLALDGDGSRLLTAHGDGTCLVWDLKTLSDSIHRDSDSWEVLSRLAPSEAQSAIVTLSRNESKALKVFAEKLTPAVEIAPAKISAWVADLDAEDFDRRISAERRLIQARDQAEPALKKAIDEPLSLEQRLRAERLLKRLDPATDPDLLRQMRAVEILERIGTKEAVALLEKLAKGAPAARLTREAKESLARLNARDD